MTAYQIPFFRPDIGEEEIAEVISVLRSGWMTSGPRVQRFEREFAAAVGAAHAVAANSGTAALHLAVEALGLRGGEAVLVPAMTFAATAEVVRYQGAIPVLVDCEPDTCNIDLGDAERKMHALRRGDLTGVPRDATVTGLMPVHVGGFMADMEKIRSFSEAHQVWVVEDAAHAFPSAWRPDAHAKWQRCGENTSAVTCFSFYANKTITTGEGGMALSANADLAERMRIMSLHGLSRDAWGRYSGKGTWDYRIIAPGFKYNMTDTLAAIGVHQVAKAEALRQKRQQVAEFYFTALDDLEQIELPPISEDRVHSWHLYPIKLQLDRLSITRNTFAELLKEAGVGFSVHWRPLHLHPYYQETFGWVPADCPVASTVWERLISLPIFPGMTDMELEYVVGMIRGICKRYAR